MPTGVVVSTLAAWRRAIGSRYYSERFQSVEVNNVFYRLPEKATFERWAAATPDDFAFSLKASRYLTHVLRLSKPTEPVRRLLGRSSGLGDKAGPVLLQLPGELPCGPGPPGLYPAGLSVECQSGVRAASRLVVHGRGRGHLEAAPGGALPQ